MKLWILITTDRMRQKALLLRIDVYHAAKLFDKKLKSRDKHKLKTIVGHVLTAIDNITLAQRLDMH